MAIFRHERLRISGHCAVDEFVVVGIRSDQSPAIGGVNLQDIGQEEQGRKSKRLTSRFWKVQRNLDREDIETRRTLVSRTIRKRASLMEPGVHVLVSEPALVPDSIRRLDRLMAEVSAEQAPDLAKLFGCHPGAVELEQL